jgi:two-component system chemotaxis response regulator CheB
VGKATPGRPQPNPTGPLRSNIELVAIASSTGGPGVLSEILNKLPAEFPVPILIVQHITPGFSQGLAEWLNQHTPLTVRLAAQADELKPGQVYIAPDGYHMQVNSMGLISLSDAPPCQGLRPSANYLFKSVARSYGAYAIGVILTGMGSDGAEGLYAMYDKGARTIAQNEATCVVFGMPAVAIEMGAVEKVLPAPQIAQTILEWTQGIR